MSFLIGCIRGPPGRCGQLAKNKSRAILPRGGQLKRAFVDILEIQDAQRPKQGCVNLQVVSRAGEEHSKRVGYFEDYPDKIRRKSDQLYQYVILRHEIHCWK